MKIVNNTRFETAHLRAWTSRIAATELDAEQRKRLRVTFVPARQQRGASGYAWFGGRVRVRVPTKAEITDSLRIDLASVIAHELHHVATQRCGQSIEINWRRSIKYGRPKTDEGKQAQRELYAWALTEPLAHRQPKVKPARDPVAAAQAKRESASLKLAEWERNAKRARTFVVKYRRKLAYYDRRIAAMNAPSR